MKASIFENMKARNKINATNKAHCSKYRNEFVDLLSCYHLTLLLLSFIYRFIVSYYKNDQNPLMISL